MRMLRYLLVFWIGITGTLYGQKHYIIQVAFVTEGYQDENFATLEKLNLGDLVREPDQKGGERVYLVGKSRQFLTKTEAKQYLARVKGQTAFNDAFIVDLKNIVAFKRYSKLEDREDILVLTISLKDEIPTS